MSVFLQLEIEKLKAENDRLKLENQGSRMGSQASISASPPPHTHSQASGTGAGLSQHSLNLTTSESTSLGKARFTWCRDYTVSFYLFEISVDGQNNLLRQWINMLSRNFLTIGFLHWLNFLKGKHGKTCLCMSVSDFFYCLSVRHAAGWHWRRRRVEEGGATRKDGCQPARGQQVGRGEACLKNTH